MNPNQGESFTIRLNRLFDLLFEVFERNFLHPILNLMQFDGVRGI